MPDFRTLVSGHREYFRSGPTRSAEWRASQLVALKVMMQEHAEDFYAALWADLRRNRVEADLTDVKYIAAEVDYVLAHLLIFGPILPVLEVGTVQEMIDFVNARPSPLGLYVFAQDQAVVEQILDSTASGDAAVNDCAVQPIIHDLPFGGVGNSGMGKYHGEWGFRAYTNARGVLYHSTRLDLGVRYPPCDHNQALRRTLGHLLS